MPTRNGLRRNVARVATAVFVVTALAIVPAAAGTWQGKEVRGDGVVTIINPAQPADGVTTLVLSEQWTAHGDSDDYLFGVLTAVASDQEGNIYLLDAQLNEVMIFAADGEFVTSIGREGEGPGEFRRPSDLFLTPDGNVAVLQRMPGKVVLLTPDGMPAGNHPLPETDGMRMLTDGALAGDGLVLGMRRMKRKDGGVEVESSLIRVDGDGKQTAKYMSRTDARDFTNMEIDETSFGSNALVWSAGPDGRVYTSNDFDAYRIEVWNADGSLNRVIEREYEARMRTAQEIEDNTPRIMIRGGGGHGGEMKVNMSKSSRAIEAMHPAEDGTLWVLSSRGAYDCGEDNIATFDVFDRNGKFMRQITLQGDGDYEQDGLHLVRDRVFVVKGFRDAQRAMFGGGDEEETSAEEPEPMSVICYGMNLMAQGKK